MVIFFPETWEENEKVAIGKPFNLLEHTCLRNIITGAVRTQLRLFKAHVVSTPVCIHCEMHVNEDTEHLFWQCPSWEDIRKPFTDKYFAILDFLPPCARQCGLLPQDFLDNGSLTVAESNSFFLELQKTMVAILRERERIIKDSHQFPGSNGNNMVVQASSQDITTDQLVAQQYPNSKENLFRRYPWDYDAVCGPMKNFFRGNIPTNWRVYEVGSEWLFGPSTFQPLVWYWSRLCKLAMPNVSEAGTTLFQRARFFADASNGQRL